MTDLEKLTFNLQERQYPYFTTEELQQLLDIHGDVWSASYYGCLLKAQNDQIELPGGLKIPSEAQYWLNLASTYKERIPNDSESVPKYKTSMNRVDGQ